ncbi:MAG: type II secretion system protein GspF [Gallionellales bacterium 35-53-114]|jgi:general secretion pathway protein F|nr:MAG: type II secretion system protein GspF [Gallionellales bacterium 35-53-114]OYZ63843.1 MAG: type II secretion system protein GspF [Gallionellales bacterium 24-53-125]OZB09326.1 MAG: type II secretion system protein GspF [Gallionellales bacterium 39-52-133]HQS59059.1 type II secretion system inner membrane protein GspF [Gallionellaceae bacterium]HQS75795.1 type II secretion system inner membrane protein GspF [Gallionellaceae bacterium]
MAAFRYEALDTEGRTVRGVAEADGLRHARARVRELGLTVVTVDAVTEDSLNAGAGQRWRFRRGISSSQLSMITRQLATLLDAGLTLEYALSALIEQSEDESVHQILAGVRSELLAGHTLAQAMGQYESVFPDIYRALIKAGEASGELGHVMMRLADYTESRQVLRQKVVLAFVYPAIVTAVALMVVLGLLIYVVPQVVSVFQQSHQTLPLLTRMLIGLSSGLQETWLYLLIALLGGGFAVRALLRREEIRFQWHLRLLRLPMVGRLVRGINTARMASTLAILAGSGVPLLISLQAAAGVVTNLPMRRAVEDAAKKVREGVTLSRALAVSGLFPPILVHLIASGENSGKLDAMLDRAATQQEQEISNYTSVLTSLLEPVLILVMGGVVLTIVLAILMPIIEMNQMVR